VRLYAAAVFRVVDLDADGKLTVRERDENTGPPAEGATRWVDLGGEDAAGLEQLRERFGFHPLAIEDCRQFDQRPKLEEYRDHLFLVTQGFTSPGEGRVRELELHELHAFLGKDYLVTVHADPLNSLEEAWRRVGTNAAVLERGVDFVYYLIASRLVEANFPILDRITEELEELEDHVLDQPARADLARIFELKRHLVMMRKVLSPQRDTLAMLARRGDPRVSERTSHYFRDVHDQLSRLNESIEANRDLLGNALDAYLSSVSNRTNEIMKYLTLLSAVFLPLAFIVGFFGQNFRDLPGLTNWSESDGLMHVMMALCILTPISMVAWFKFRRWI
jgi:magnesium transporter